jgi:hypothetical protein
LLAAVATSLVAGVMPPAAGIAAKAAVGQGVPKFVELRFGHAANKHGVLKGVGGAGEVLMNLVDLG